jgi:hypothetical protein
MMGGSVLQRFLDTMESLGRRYCALPAWAVASALSVVILVKAGMVAETANIRDAYLPAAEALPAPSGYFSASVGNLVIGRVLGATSVPSWVVLHAVLVALAMGTAYVSVSRGAARPPNYGLLLAAIMAGAAGLTVTIGKYDPLTFAGAFLLACSPGWRLAAVGALLMALGNPEQAVVASACLLVLTFASPYAHRRTRAWLGVGASAITLTLVHVWFLVFGQYGNRATALPGWLLKSLEQRWSEGVAGVWSWYGVGWLLVAAVLMWLRGRERWLAGASLVLIPMLVTLVTVDGARVFALCALPAFLVAVAGVLSDSEDPRRFGALGLLVALFVVCPW